MKRRQKIAHLLVIALVGVFLLTVLVEFYQLTAHPYWSEKYRPFWYAGLAGLAIFTLLALAGLWVYLAHAERCQRTINRLIQTRQRLGVWRWLIALPLALLPAVLTFFISPSWVLSSAFLRLFAWLGVGLSLAFLLTRSDRALVTVGEAAFSLLLLSSLHVIASYLAWVTPYPFSLTWSEGNRFYDYSVMLGGSRYLYDGRLTIPYFAPGRYLLWGMLFAIPGTPIWLHRLWDAVLWTAPHLLLGILAARWSHLSKMGKASFALWGFLFLFQGPVYTPLVLSAILVVLAASQKRWWLAALGVALAGYYAGLSRWSWVAAPAMWAVVIQVARLDDARLRSWREFTRRMLPIAGIALAGLVGGILSNPEFFTPREISTMTMRDQPLLWYRLLPNATNPQGILLGAVAASAPLAGLLIWAAVSHRWRVSWLQAMTYLAAGLASLLVGLAASVKIGGGSNLHNLDMFLITLLLLAGLALSGRRELGWRAWTTPAQFLLLITLALPAVAGVRSGEPLRLPHPAIVEQALQTISEEVNQARQRGEVLFIDQRQLLTFGLVPVVPLVPEYEKKYLMDMAMGNNQAYFDSFHADLKRGRFALIVSEVLRAPPKGESDSYGEENNAWVKWVVKPVLCYYQPLETLANVRVQLLVPRENPQDCP